MTAVEQVGAEYARQLTDRIKVAVEGTWQLIVESARIEAWSLLGYASWDEYVQREFGTSSLRLPREEREEVIGSLRDMGLSVRRIAAITNAPKSTVSDVLSGVRDRTPVPEHLIPVGPDGIVVEATGEFAALAGELAAADAGYAQQAAAASPKVTGVDGKEYSATGKSAPRKSALTDDAIRLGSDIRKVIERLERLIADKRFQQYEQEIATALRGHLQYAADITAGVLAQLP